MEVVAKHGGYLTSLGQNDVRSVFHFSNFVCHFQQKRNAPRSFRHRSSKVTKKGEVIRSRRLSVLCSVYGESSGKGDPKKQELLVEMIRMEISKVRMRDVLDKSSQNIQDIALQTQLDYAQLADLTLKRLDASGSQILNQLDADAIAIRDEFELVNADIEAKSRNFEESQIFAIYSRNEGLFFKNLYKAPPVLAYRSNLSTPLTDKNSQLHTSVTQDDLTRGYRQVLYGGISLVFLSFLWSASSAFTSGTSMRSWKLISYGIIMSLLLAQLAYAKELIEGPPTQKPADEKSEKIEKES